MANTKSAKKAARQASKRQAQNRVLLSGARTAVKKARLAVASGDPNAEEAVRQAVSTLDRAASKGVIHRNNASRRKARLMKLYAKSEHPA